MIVPILVFGLSFGADGYSTLRARERPGSYEQNPLLQDRGVMIGAKVAETAACIWVDRKLSKRSKVLMWVVRGAAVGINAKLYHDNMKLAHR